MKVYVTWLAFTILASVSPALALSFTDIAIVSPAGSDANDCIWHTPFAPPQPPACATAAHAASLLSKSTVSKSSKLAFLTGTYHEHVSVAVPKAIWPNIHSGFNVGKLTSSDNPIFDGGSFSFTGDGWAGLRGIRINKAPGDCISMHGLSATDPMHGAILDEIADGCGGHAVTLVNTDGVEVGYDWYSDSGAGESELFLSNSPNFNIHETQLAMLVGKKPQLGASITNSPHGIYGVNVDVYVAPTGLDAESSPFMQILQGNKAYKASICPASDVATDTVASNVTVTSSCIVP
jgi:hypothetical protein